MADERQRGVEDPFAVLLPVAMGLVTVAVVVFEGTVAALAGVAGGVGLVVVGGLLRYRENDRESAGE